MGIRQLNDLINPFPKVGEIWDHPNHGACFIVKSGAEAVIWFEVLWKELGAESSILTISYFWNMTRRRKY